MSRPGPPFHRGITESFHVLSGTVRLYGRTRVHAVAVRPGAPREDHVETLADQGG